MTWTTRATVILAIVTVLVISGNGCVSADESSISKPIQLIRDLDVCNTSDQNLSFVHISLNSRSFSFGTVLPAKIAGLVSVGIPIAGTAELIGKYAGGNAFAATCPLEPYAPTSIVQKLVLRFNISETNVVAEFLTFEEQDGVLKLVPCGNGRCEVPVSAAEEQSHSRDCGKKASGSDGSAERDNRQIAQRQIDQALQHMQHRRYADAMAIFEPLAVAGDDRSMINMGLFYHQGQGVKQDYGQAINWYLRAFAKGNGDAYSNIGVMFRDGLGVPANKKIAYCLFLITHMRGLGTEDTQYRANSCLRRILDDMTKDDIRECFGYTEEYIEAYVKSKGSLKGIPNALRPSTSQPALKDKDWWMDGELDFLEEE